MIPRALPNFAVSRGASFLSKRKTCTVYIQSLYRCAKLYLNLLDYAICQAIILKELNTAIQCLGIKPKAINDSCIKDTERNGI